MKYTVEQLNNMSAGEINEALVLKIGFKPLRRCFGDSSIRYEDKEGGQYHRDYCNNWNDIMPLVLEYDITINPCNGWCHFIDEKGFVVEITDESPQRAIACCLLMMETD